MKICILSSIGRSGTTSLFNIMCECLPRYYTCLNEPFGPTFDGDGMDIIKNNTNVLVKELLNHRINDEVFPYEWPYQTFDKIIIMDRRNKREQAESHAINSYNEVAFTDWHQRKVYDLSNIPEEYIQKLESQATDLMKEHKGKVYYYEDVFLNHNLDLLMEIINSVGIQTIPVNVLYEHFYSIDKKVRIVKNLI